MSLWDVHLTDQHLSLDEAEVQFAQAKHWAEQHCVSFYGYAEIDVSDTSWICDTVVQYTFTSEADALMFKLKWV